MQHARRVAEKRLGVDKLREGFPQAWDVTHGDSALVGVIDTGIDASHPDLAGKIAAAEDFDSDPGDGPATTDESGHGTHVASLACAATGNGVGIAGAGYGCRLVVETAVKLGEMEKDKTILIQSHFDLMSASFRKLAEPI